MAMKMPRFAQRIADRFNAETNLGFAHGWHAAHTPQARHAPAGPLRLVPRWLDKAGERLDVLLAHDAAQHATDSTLRRLGRAATFPARLYLTAANAFGYATAESVGWYEGHRAGPGPRPGRPHHGVSGGYGAVPQFTRHGIPARGAYRGHAAGSRPAAAAARAAGSGRASGQQAPPAVGPAAVGRLSYAAPASHAPQTQPGPQAVAVPAAPARRAITGGRSR